MMPREMRLAPIAAIAAAAQRHLRAPRADCVRYTYWRNEMNERDVVGVLHRKDSTSTVIVAVVIIRAVPRSHLYNLYRANRC